jgi:hypothetical protein
MVGGGGFWPVMLFFLSRAGKGGVSERLASEVRLVCPHGVWTRINCSVSIHAGRAECSASSEARAGGQEQGFGDTTKNGNGLACSATLDFDSAISMWPCQYFLSILWQVHTKNISQLSTMAKVVQRQLMAVRGIRAFHSWFVQYMHPSMKQFSEACTRFPQRKSERFEFPVRFICLQALQHARQFSAIVHRYADA